MENNNIKISDMSPDIVFKKNKNGDLLIHTDVLKKYGKNSIYLAELFMQTGIVKITKYRKQKLKEILCIKGELNINNIKKI